MCHLATVALLVGPGVLSAQAGIGDVVPFNGRVVSAVGAPVSFAQVAIPSLSLLTQTRDDGRFVLNIPTARAQGQTVVVTVRALGFKPLTASLVLTAPIASVTYTVETNPLHLGE